MLDTAQTTATITVEACALFDALRRVRHAISNDDTRYYLRGVFMHVDEGKLAFVATDGHRLARTTIDFGEDESRTVSAAVLLPEEAVDAILKVKKITRTGDTRIGVSPTKVSISILTRDNPQPVIDCQPIQSTFPDYKRIIPCAKNLQRAYTVDRKALLETVSAFAAAGAALAHAREYGDAQAHTKFTFDESTLVCESRLQGVTMTARHEVAFETVSDSFVVGMSARYVRDILKTFEGETIVVKFRDNSSPITFSNDLPIDRHALSVLMPVRI